MLSVFLISICFSGALALSAFDCRGVAINKTTISLIETPICASKKPNITSQLVSVAVTQTTSISEISFLRCKLEAFHHVQRCGVSLDTWHNSGYYSEVLEITRDECIHMVHSSFINLRWGSNTRVTLPKGGYFSYSYTSFGNIDGGSCTSGGTLTSPSGIRWDRAIRNTRLEMTYTMGMARLFHDEGQIKFPNGVICNVLEGSCDHSGYGHLFWSVPSPDCRSTNSKNSLVFKGMAQLIVDKDSVEVGSQYIHVNQGDYDFQVKLGKAGTSICGFNSYSTEHPRLFVTIVPPNSPDFPMIKPVGSEDVNLLNYINSKFVYVMRHTKQEVDRLFRLFEQERCHMQNRITENLMTLALISPKEFAFQYFKAPGYTAVVRGEVVHVAKCREVAVMPRVLTDECYNELPVNYNNQTWFMTPRTRVLIRHGTKVECASDIGPQFMLNGRWVTPTSTGLMSVKLPFVISPDPLQYEFEQLDDIANNGLYSSETILKYQKILTSPLEERVISTRIADAISGKYNLPDGISIRNAFTDVDFDMIDKKLNGWSKVISESSKNIGGWFGFFLFVVFSIRAIVAAVNSFVNFRFLKRTHGVLIAALFCIFDSIAHYIVRGDILKNKRKDPTPAEDDSDGDYTTLNLQVRK